MAVIAAAACAVHIQYQQATYDIFVYSALLLVVAAIAVLTAPAIAFLLKRWPAHAAKRRFLALSTIGPPLVWVA